MVDTDNLIQMTPSVIQRLYGTSETLSEHVRLTLGDAGILVNSATGAITSITYDGHEICSGIDYLLRDEGWGTVEPMLDRPAQDSIQSVQQPESWRFEYSASFKSNSKIATTPELHVQLCLSYGDEGLPELEIVAELSVRERCRLCRHGFVVLHPMALAGVPVHIEHTKGTTTDGSFPVLVEPCQPFTDIRRLSHGVTDAECIWYDFDVDRPVEIEDQRQWGDASFKSYVGPLALRHPYDLAAGTVIKQRLVVTIRKATAPSTIHTTSIPPWRKKKRAIALGLPLGGELGTGKMSASVGRQSSSSKNRQQKSGKGASPSSSDRKKIPSSQSQIRAEKSPKAVRVAGKKGKIASPAVARQGSGSSDAGQHNSSTEGLDWVLSDAVRGSGCRMLHVRFNEMDGHGVGTLEFYKRIADKADLLIILECVFRRSRGWDHVEQVFGYMDMAAIWGRVSAIMAVPAMYLGASSTADCFGMVPQTVADDADAADALYESVGVALSHHDRTGRIRLLAGAVSSFTELNRRRPRSPAVHGVMHSVSAIIHDASDAAVMSTPDTLPGVIDTVRSIFPSKEYWLGPCTIATRGTPYGDSSLGGAVTKALDVNGLKRTPLATNDPRQRGCFGAAYTLALIAKVLTRGAKCMGLGDIVGDRGIMALELAAEDTAPLWHQAAYVTSRAGRQRAGTLRVHPVFHVVRGFGRAAGAVAWDLSIGDPTRICAAAFFVKPATIPTTPRSALSSGRGAMGTPSPKQRTTTDPDGIDDGRDITTPPPNTDRRRSAHNRFDAKDWHHAMASEHFTGEVWIGNITSEIQDVCLPLGYKASFAVALIDHTAATRIADHDIQFLDQTLSSVILSPSPDPRNLTLELSPYAVARVVITPHTQSHFERS